MKLHGPTEISGDAPVYSVFSLKDIADFKDMFVKITPIFNTILNCFLSCDTCNA